MDFLFVGNTNKGLTYQTILFRLQISYFYNDLIERTMKKLIITTDTENQAKLLATFLENHQMVRAVSISSEDSSEDDYNWTNPSRPATDEEFEQMIQEAEAEYKEGKGMNEDEAKAKTNARIEEWRKQQGK
ncbi:MAG: hypothetical protein BRD50_01820 [Bacteroidetes bacterium SW_11_45_7]|nr:MAG: hypothetical protein BRD50_01820 [Bacteroidetes bacterium SW_11_45_7]